MKLLLYLAYHFVATYNKSVKIKITILLQITKTTNVHQQKSLINIVQNQTVRSSTLN